MKITREKLLEELNKDLEWEYAAAVQYLQHAATINSAKFDFIKKELLVHSQEEMQHATMLADHIDFLGGVPTIDIEKREISADGVEMLKQDLWGENNAIARYKTRIEQAEALKEFGLRRVLEDILVMEEEHKRDIQDALAK